MGLGSFTVTGKRVLLTSARSPAGLDLARLLARDGCLVYMAESQAVHLCHFSRYVRKVFSVPPPSGEGNAYAEALRDIVISCKIDLLIPCYEETFAVARSRETLVPYCEVFTDCFSRLDELHDKFRFVRLCEEIGLAVPESQRIVSRAELTDALALSSEEAVVKPVYSRYGEDVVYSDEVDKMAALKPSAQRPLVYQRRLLGSQYSAYAVAVRGEVRALAIYPHRESRFHVTMHYVPCDHPGIVLWVKTFVEACGFTGQISFDFIEEAGRVVAIECNPRITGGIHLFAGSRNFSQVFFREVVIDSAIRGEGPASALSLMLLTEGKIRDALAARDVVFKWSDPLPAFNQVIAFFYLCFLARSRRLSLAQASMCDIAYDGMEALG